MNTRESFEHWNNEEHMRLWKGLVHQDLGRIYKWGDKDNVWTTTVFMRSKTSAPWKVAHRVRTAGPTRCDHRRVKQQAINDALDNWYD